MHFTSYLLRSISKKPSGSKCLLIIFERKNYKNKYIRGEISGIHDFKKIGLMVEKV